MGSGPVAFRRLGNWPVVRYHDMAHFHFAMAHPTRQLR